MVNLFVYHIRELKRYQFSIVNHETSLSNCIEAFVGETFFEKRSEQSH